MSPDKPKNELPIACSLNAGEIENRHNDLIAIGRSSLIEVVHRETGSVELRFESDPATRAELERIVAAEAECCAFLDMKLAGSASLQLTIDGPEGTEPIIDELVEGFSAEAAA